MIKYISVVQLLSCAQSFVTSWTAARQASLSITISQSLFKLVSIDLVMPSNHSVPLVYLFFFPLYFNLQYCIGFAIH